ncbi:hypothetical protein MMPV_010082 [Pyropia vietnamensis]
MAENQGSGSLTAGSVQPTSADTFIGTIDVIQLTRVQRGFIRAVRGLQTECVTAQPTGEQVKEQVAELDEDTEAGASNASTDAISLGGTGHDLDGNDEKDIFDALVATQDAQGDTGEQPKPPAGDPRVALGV